MVSEAKQRCVEIKEPDLGSPRRVGELGKSFSGRADIVLSQRIDVPHR